MSINLAQARAHESYPAFVQFCRHRWHQQPKPEEGLFNEQEAFETYLAGRDDWLRERVLAGDEVAQAINVLRSFAEGPSPFTTGDAKRAADTMTRVNAALADLDSGKRMMMNGVGLLAEAAALFRHYEAHHRAKIGAESVVMPYDEDAAALEKAERNADIANRIEAFLQRSDTPRDRIAGLALSLVQDLGDMFVNRAPGGEAEWREWLGPEAWSSYTRLRDALDADDPAVEYETRNEEWKARYPINAAPVKRMDGEDPHYETTANGDVAAFGACPGRDGEPTLTLVVNGTEYRTTSTSVRGKLGGCPIRAEWDGKTDLRVHIDTPGYVPPPAPSPIVYGGNLRAADPSAFAEAAGIVFDAEVGKPPEPFAMTTCDPRFRPDGGLTVNGFAFIPAPKEKN